INKDAGTLNILWTTNAGSTAAATLGFTADDTGGLNYIGDNAVRASTAGYTISSRDVTDRFLITGTNDDLQIMLAGDSGGVSREISLNAGTYSGSALAVEVQNQIRALGTVGGVDYSQIVVSYNEATDRFTIDNSTEGTNIANLEAGTNDALPTIGFTAITGNGDTDLVSNNAIAFNIITGQNDEFDIAVDSGTVYTIDIDPGIYNASDLVTEIQNGLDSDNGGVLNGLTTVSYASNKFTITSSNSTGINSSIALTSGTDDLLSFLNLDDGFRVNGTDSTPLSDLNRGSGVDTSNPIRITDRRGNTADVTITDQDGSGTITVKDVITLINDVAGLNVIASLNSAGNGINITDTTSSNERIANLKIEEVGGGSAAADLGILADLPYNTIYGTDLDPGVSSYTRISSLKGGQGLTMGSIHIINGPSLVPVTITNGVGANDTLRVIHSTAGAATITLSSGTFSGDKMAEEIGTRLNSNTPLTSGGIIYTVNYDSGINRFTVSANSGTITLDNSVGTADETLGFVFNPVAASSITSNAGDIDLFSGLPAGDLSVGDILDRISNPARINNPNLNITASIDSSLTALDVKSNNSGTTAIVLDNSGTLTSDLGIQGSQNILKTLNAFTEALDRGDRTAVRNILDHLDTGLDKISEKQGDAGARVNRLETTNEGLLDMQLNVTTLLSETEDIDMIKVMTDLMTAQNTYEATLAATAKVMRLTLLNFL
ncbi:MAG: flagellin, partial [Nitrospinota bacterium]